jgi:hypothetical protein
MPERPRDRSKAADSQLEARLNEIAADNGYGAAVDFHHEAWTRAPLIMRERSRLTRSGSR